MLNLLYIALGGAIGSILRYLSCESIIKLLRSSNYANFPFATLFVNVAGSMMAGILYYFLIKHFDAIDIKTRNFLLIGVLGGFTTFSAFSLDFFRLFMANQYTLAFVYALTSFALAILAIFFGFYLMKLIFV